jgi:hydrogenase nickel incorporation protein HypA/HybF
MHELAITQSVLDIALEHARKEGAAEIARINLVIGQMTGVSEECVRFYLGVISRGTAAQNAELAVRQVPITARCQDCAEEYEVRDLAWACPRCQSTRSDIIGGSELIVESIEVSNGKTSLP